MKTQRAVGFGILVIGLSSIVGCSVNPGDSDASDAATGKDASSGNDAATVGVCSPLLGKCDSGEVTNDNNAVGCGTTRTWWCGAGTQKVFCDAGATPDCVCSPNALQCDSGVPNADNKQTLCGTTRTWSCSDGGKATPCSFENPCVWTPLDAGTHTILNAVWASGENDVWVVGDLSTILRYDNNNWTSLDSGVNSSLLSIWGSAADNVTFVGINAILRWNGSNIRPLTDAGAPYKAIWGYSSIDIWVIDYASKIYHWNGSNWDSGPITPPGNMLSIWVANPNDIWIAGSRSRGEVRHLKDNAWLASDIGDSEALYGVWGSSPTNIWIVGNKGTVLRGDGGTWTPEPRITDELLNAVGGSGPDDVWAVGNKGTIIHWNGKEWKPSISNTQNNLISISAANAHDVWAVGENGTILRLKQ